jgi:hypothetical protein
VTGPAGARPRIPATAGKSGSLALVIDSGA